MTDDPGDVVWRNVTDALLAGLIHDLNGRVAGLRGLLHVVSLGDRDEEVMSLLLGEGERLEVTVSLLRRYPRGGSSVEAFDPRELAEAALALHARREDHEDVPVAFLPAPDAPAARADRIGTMRALLVLLARAAVPALGGQSAGVQVTVGGDAAGAVIAIRAPGLEGEGVADPYLVAADGLARAAGAALRTTPGSWEIVLPALSE